MLLPFVARLAPKVDARILISLGFVAVGASVFYSAQTMNLDIDFAGAVRLRILQCAGFAFLFVPIQSIVYGGLPVQKHNQVASIINLSRNVGADLGIAFLITIIYRHRQSYQVQFASHTGRCDTAFNSRLEALARLFKSAGTPSVEAARRALAATYTELQNQAMQLAYFDAMRGIAALAFAGAVVAWGARRLKAPTAAASSH
jgi:DHA2 family multidrug resistance protein